MRRVTPNRLLAFADGLLTRAVPGGGDRTASWVLSSAPSALPTARRMTRARLVRWGLQDQIKVADLLVSELVTNALRDSGDRIRLTLTAEDGLLRCEVEHADPSRSRCRMGREHLLLADLACCWGTAHTCEGKVVWFELPAPGLV
ncbi:ATP-binding protein [Nonomuraea sp. NPDC049152]|uniref:ATP-binding protein n=1 Tax=Nonomuraea sp. NPDC049152 TaxID=3154350 RepID=UPI0033F072F8